jgi:tetraacyldisaccharide 4'-kinase
MKPPEFWSNPDDIIAQVLDPIGRIVGAITTWRAERPGVRAPIRIVSIGGVTVGGAGKTPVTASVAALLRARDENVAVILRGYGGRLRGPVRVDAASHDSADVGDEALLHAADRPTWIAARRIEGCIAAAREGATVAVLDDGHQHPGLHKDLSILVVDGRDPFGNGRVVPAGPLREPPDDAAHRAQALIIVGDDVTDLASRVPPHLVVLGADLVPGPEAANLRGQRVVAFAGIGNPKKFFRQLEEIGAQVVARHPFEDHHRFDLADIQPILDEAFSLGAIPITTAKDAVRLPRDQRQQVNVLTARIVWRDEAAVCALLAGIQGRGQAGR